MTFRTLGLSFAVAALAACGGSTTGGSTKTLNVTAGAATIRANGLATTSITVSGEIKYPLSIRTTLGTFENNLQSITVATAGAGGATATLRPCDSAANAACAGSAQVTATDSALSVGRTAVVFQPLEICNDLVDNDANHLADCADTTACAAGTSCGSHGKTCGSGATAGTCACPFGNAEVCNDGADNDCNGLVDCEDPACQGATATAAGQACDAANPTYKCVNTGTGTAVVWACKDTSNFTLTLTPAAAAVPANGAASTTLAAKLMDTGTSPASPVVGKTVTFTVSPDGLATVTASAVTDAAGVATATLASASVLQSGTATATATYAWGTSSSVSASTAVLLPQLTGISLTAQKYGQMGAKGSGYQEDQELTFKLVTATNGAYPAGLAVAFTHQASAGSFIGSTATCSGTPLVCTATGLTDSSGLVKVALHPGTVAGVVSVTAIAQAGSAAVQQVTASNLPIVGAKASGAQFVLDCTPKNVPAFTNSDCTNSNYGGTEAAVTCVATLADRYQNVLGVPTAVSYVTEAGIISGTGTTDSATGKASGKLTVTGAKLPLDVEPTFDEAWVIHNLDGCGTRTHNPRDGLATVIAKVSGEEGFVDGSNGCPADGVYNAPGTVCTVAGSACCLKGENYIDIGEPFVDYNDNGVQDGQEPYTDLNGNGRWDGPNGKWDKDTTLWAQTRILYTDYVRQDLSTGMETLSRFTTTASYPAPTAPTGFSVIPAKPGPPAVAATSVNVPFYLADYNLNYPTKAYSFGTAASGSACTAAFLNAPGAFDTLGLLFSQQYCSVTNPSDVTTQCSANLCQSAPCYPVAFVGGYSYGLFGYLRISGTATALPVVPVGAAAGVTSTLNGVRTDVTIDGVVF